MEDEERQKKLEAGKAKLAEYRQRKAHADSQKKQKKKKKKNLGEDSEGDSQRRVEVEPDQSVGREVSGGGQDGSQDENKDPPTTAFTFARTLRSGETVKHDQTYTIEPESEMSTTAEDYSSEVNGCHDEMTENLMMPSKDFIWEEVESLQQLTKGGTMEDALAAKTQAVEELSRELEEIRAAFGTEGVQQLQDFEAALKQRDGIITQLTANLQQAREEKDEIMKEFLELTEQSQKLHIQFQQLQAGETLRNTSHSSTAADLLQARQQLLHYQPQLEELQLKLNEMEMSQGRSEESFTLRIKEKDLIIGEQEKVILSQRTAEQSFAQSLKEKNHFISEQTAIITEHELSLTLLREELAHVGRTTDENIINPSDEKDLIIAEQERVISERDCSLTQLEDELESSEKHLRDLQQRMAAKESELERCMDELENSKADLESCKREIESCNLELERERAELESFKGELSASRQKERMSSNEIMQLMGTVEDLQKRCHQDSLSESDTMQQMEEETLRKLELLRAELDEMYGQQIVQMKLEVNLQHAAKVEQMTEQHRAELELLKAQQLSQSSTVGVEVDTLNAKIRELQETLEQSQSMQDKARHELSQVSQEKFNLQAKVEDLLRDLRSAKENVEQVSHTLISRESQKGELLRLQETIDNLKSELATAREAAQESEIQHESEVTNYKIKLDMLEREKDAVLDRMAESQEAELDRLRTQLLFSHEEELTVLREDLQRESFLNTENLLNEAAIKHEKVLDGLRVRYEEELHLLKREKAGFATERDELFHQIVGLKEDLKLALHSSKADALVQQLQELQVELEELRKGGGERAKMENEIKSLRKKKEALDNQTKEKEQLWESKWKQHKLEKEELTESNSTLKEELNSKIQKIETLEAEINQMQQKVVGLGEEIETQRTTFSFAEKNFEVNYQELKEEYTCLIEAKTQLEQKTLKETLEFEAKIASLQSQIQELEENSRDLKMEDMNTDRREQAVIEKDTTELMEKLTVTLSEKESLAGRLSEVTEQLMFTESKVRQLEEELTRVREANVEVITQSVSLGKDLEKKQEIMRKQTRGQDAQREAKHQQEEQTVEPVCSFDGHHLQIQSLQEEIKALQSLLQAAESERDGVQQTSELRRLSQTPSPAALGEGPVGGRSSPHKPTASGSSRRKRRQRSKQERKLGSAPSDCREEKQREEEEEAAGEEERATSAAEQEMQPQMESQVMSCSQERAGEEDSTDGYQGDGDYINKQVSRHGSDHHTEPVVCLGAEGETTEHGECRLQMEAQRISLSQIHAAQLELLQEDSDARAHTLELKLQDRKDHGDHDESKIFKYQNMLQAVSEECSEIIQCFQRMFGEEFLESVAAEERPPPSVERPDTNESTSTILEARELYRNLQQVRERIEQEHHRLSQLQALLRADGNKMTELQVAYDELKSSSEKEISDLRVQVSSSSPSTTKDLEEHAGAPSTSLTKELQRLKVEEQEKQLQLEESHRQEMEHLRAHYQQQATESEERYATELFMLQQRLQEVAGTQTHDSAPESSFERMEEHGEELKVLGEEGLSEGGEELRWPVRSAGLTVQLQALRKALYHKYVQEVAALKEQHNRELRKLTEEKYQERKTVECQEERGERGQDLNGINGARSSSESLGAAGQAGLEDKQHWERVEEEVAKAIVQMSVEFAQQIELARINKRACQRSTAMQTRSDKEEVEEMENAEQTTPRAPLTSGAWLEEVEKERLERELEERNAEIRKLREELQKTESRPEQALKKREDGQEQFEKEEDPGGPGIKQAGGGKLSSENDGESSDDETERNVLRKANEKLSQVLVDVLKTTAAAEETMGLHMQSLRDATREGQQAAPPHSDMQRAKGHSAESCQGSETAADDVSLWSGETEADDGLEQMMERLLLGAGTQLENEEYLMGISSRLQTALEKMLMAITDTTNQLEHARLTQTELMRESFRHNQEISGLLQKQEELQERLSEEGRAREQLALELHHAEGLIDGYTGERAALEEQLRQKEELQLSLEQELQVTGSQLHELEQERLQMQDERELLSRQQDAMKEHAGPRELRLVEAAMVAAPEADLLEETEKLMKEKVEVQRQAEKENTDLLKHVKLLEAELEEQVNKVIELEHAQSTESGDLRQQVQALEKQLDKNRKFLDEQAVDREHERDFFQQEIQKLENQLKNPQKLQAGSEQRNKEVDQLTSQLKEKADWCSELLLSSEQLRRELGERDEEIDKLESRIRELEQALLASAESLEEVEQKKQHASITEAKQATLEAQLQTEREALERKEKEICNLEEQLEQFKEELENKSEEVQQLHMQLEIQRKEISSQEQYLETRDSMIQEIDNRDELIKDFESQVECLRCEQERLKRNNEEELDQLNAVIDRLQQELANIEQKQATEEDEDTKVESSVWGPSIEEYDEMKQKMDLATKEINTLKTKHSKLLETYLRLKESAEALAETEKTDSAEGKLEDALREKTAGFVVMQAQVQALEQSATSRVEELALRIQQLEDEVGEKDSELSRCRLLVEQTQSYAAGLQQRVSNLEEKLREKLASALVSQATLEAFQQQKSQGSKEKQDQQSPAEPNVQSNVYDFGDFGIPQMDFSGIGQTRQVPTGKVVHLTQRLRELEVGLSGMQKDQELQKQLLSSSEEEVLEYERRLAVLMDLLSQMKARTHQRTSPAVRASSADEQPAAVSELLQELQEVRDEASATKEQLACYKQSCSKLQEELQDKTVTIERLKDQLQKVSSGGLEEAKVSELQQELTEAQNEAASTKEELNSCRESLEKLQELLQEREMTIANLKGELFKVQAEESRDDITELLEEVRNDAASTKEELNIYRQRNEKLQEDLQVREVSISKLKEELQEMRENVDTTKQELNSYRQHNENLQNELHVRELSISKLKEELQEVRTALMKAADSGPPSPSPSPSPQPVSSASSSSTTQPKRKGSKQPAGKGSSAKDKPSLSRKNSAPSSQSSNKSHSSRLNSSSEQQHVTVTHSFTQTEPLQMSDLGLESESATKDEMEEVIGEFQEKIDQMQELHAAEILDMEARHISESESLRRDTQALENECKALKAVIDKLRSTEALSSRQERPTSLFKDGYTSDSSSDYSQRTGFDFPSLQQEFRSTPEGARRETDDPLPDRIKTLLREVHTEGMQVLSLSELPLTEGEPGSQFNVPGWVKERDALLATVESLKGLITQMQTHRETQTSGGVDWRAELLDAVRQVFMRERSVLKSALYSQLDLLDTSDAIIHLNQLERRLAEQDAVHREAMGSLHTADRSSLISEIHQLRGQLEQLHQGALPVASLGDERSAKEQGGGADGAAEADRLLVEELKSELSQTQLELETTLKAQHKHLKELDTLRAEVSQKAAEVDALNDQLTEDRKKSRDLQWAMEKERCRTGKNEESKREELEDLNLSLEEQKSRVAQLTLTLEQERQASSQLSQQADQERLSLHSRLQEFQVQLETERAKALEMSTALGRERELRTGVSSDSGPSSEQREEEDGRRLDEEGSLLERLQRELDDKHTQVVHLLSQVEAQKLEVVRKEEELTLGSQRSRRDQEALLEARAQLERLEAQMSEAQEQLERETRRSKSLEGEKERLEERLSQLAEQRGGRDGSGPLQADGHSALLQSESTDRTKDWVFQQKSGNVQSASSTTSPHLEASPTGHTSGPHQGPWRTVDKILGKLHLISSKIRSMANKNTGRLTAEVDSEEISWVQSNVNEVITMLQQSPGLPSIPEQSVSLLAGGSTTTSSSNTLTERLLRQNAELTGFVSRLTEEKNDLRNHTLRLEEELRRYRNAGLGSGDSFSSRRGVSKADSSGMILSQEREAWTREKVRLEKALLLAQTQVARLRGEIRTDTLREITGPEADNAALKRMYGKYLRSESFRKALIYQKKYLLLLLGGFQECEEATLSLLSRMGGRPALPGVESLSQHRRGLMRFRSAVQVSIALSRMRFLVKRWHKATGMSSTTTCSVNKNGAGMILGTEVRDSPYLHPGSVDMYRDRGSGGGVSSGRGRSGRESPRSAVSSTQHRFHMAGDHGALTCSHLQSYDPDRALTDYISRLEALQRRLGSVTSGASSYAQLHFGLRR
ncbi:A-kinase anchor protein 9 isoform X3 [Anoplopoma fimbria]|uniref:A-kinase anchor protein 9 isoform X3 n=1 Tax=Anoplopoma fimbria TaxID=229290 RepID=UPI0023ECEF77|nr:A-kinase anchor protein 9 isoform X3 [Anoplopoma fimbria]